MRRLLPILLAALLPAQDPDDPLRRALRHDELLARWQQVAANGSDPAKAEAAAKIAELSAEQRLLARAGTTSELTVMGAVEVLRRLAALELDAGEAQALAGLCVLHGDRRGAEAALGRARDLDPLCKAATDARVAALRGEPVPDGGYHRYRGAWWALGRRDLARALDEAFDGLAELRIEGLVLPFVRDAGKKTSCLEAVEKLGPRAGEFLRTTAERVRKLLAADYDGVRGWLLSYREHVPLGKELLEQRGALQKPRAAARELIARYDKPEQDEVDRMRGRLEEMHAAYQALRARDLVPLQRVSDADAWALATRLRGREAALAAVDRALLALGEPGLGPMATPRPHVLPGREQSGLEDVLWFVVHWRAGLLADARERGADLLRQSGRLTPWEVMVVEDALADLVDLYNERVACSLDGVEREFVAVLNRYRRVLGLVPFEVEERLNVSARKHSQEMVDLGYFGHISPVARNRGPTDRARLEGFAGGVGENCLAGQVDGRGAFEGWYRSPGHHRNLVSGGPQLGVGAVNSHAMWTMVCGGHDRTWPSLHRDLAPHERQAPPLPADQLAPLARRAFPAARDPNDPAHETHPELLARLIDAEVGSAWRALQVAAVAAGIESLLTSPQAGLRQRTWKVLAPLLGEAPGYDPAAPRAARDEAVRKLRAHWEDVAQWRYRPRDASAPALPPVLQGIGDGASKRAPHKALGKRERLALARKFGGGAQTEAAVEKGLLWLARAQDQDGAWRARAYGGNAQWEVAMTGIALLAFTAAGNTLDAGEHQRVVQRGCEFLLQRILDYGRFESTASHYLYAHAIATQALCELYAYSADPRLCASAQLCVDYLLFAQDEESGGWRYEAREYGDLSVTGWVVLALNAAHKAGLAVGGLRSAQRFVDSVTRPGYYFVGYQNPYDRATNDHTLTAVALTCRLFFGEEPARPQIALASERMVRDLPRRDRLNFYYWYYATLATFQLGDERWRRWHEALAPLLLSLQEEDGRWPLDGLHGNAGGHVLQTALGVLMLTSYYRYDRLPKIPVVPFTGDLKQELAPALAELRAAGDDQARALVLRRLVDRFGASIVPALAQLLRERQDPIEVRHAVARALGEVAQPHHDALLLPLLADPDGGVCDWAARALSRIASPRSVPALCAALAHRERHVRGFAARALGRLGDRAAVAPLGTALRLERDNFVRHEIEVALQALSRREPVDELVDQALGGGAAGRIEVVEALAGVLTADLGKLLAARRAAEPKLWERCLQAVREQRGYCLIPLLITLLDSQDEATRTEANKLLGAVAGRGFDFDPKAGPELRRKAITRAQAWWKECERGYTPRR
jgi:HEAT repeat protein